MSFGTSLIFFFISILGIVCFPLAGKIKAQIDPTFGTNGVATVNAGVRDLPLASFVLPDGKILVVSGTDCCTTPFRVFFIRVNVNGTLDSTYGTNGITEVFVPYTASQGNIHSAVRQTDGKIIVIGQHNAGVGIVARYNEDGTLDTSFANGGVHRPDLNNFGTDKILSAVIQPDNKILVGGYSINGSGQEIFTLLRYLPNGSLDTSFGTGGFIGHNSIRIEPDMAKQFLFLQSSGKIIVCNFEEIGNELIRRLNADGSIDNSFTPVMFPDHHTAKTAFVQPDGKILTAGTIVKTETLERVHTDVLISRYNADGTIDTGFGTNGQTSFDITNYQSDRPVEFQVLPDGQIIVAVDASITPNRTFTGGSMLSYARLSTSGAVIGKFIAAVADNDDGDMSFTSILPDGKILTVFRKNFPNYDILLVRSLGVPLVTYKLHGMPYAFGGFNTLFAKPSVYRPSQRLWFLQSPQNGIFFGLPDDIPVPSDYISNDFAPELAVFRPSNGTWYIARTYNGASTNFLAIQWGLANDIPTPADFDGDGKSDLAVFRPSKGVWYIRNSVDNSYTFLHWGLNGDKPVVGDYDGDGKYDIGIFRPSEGNWYIIRSSDNGYTILHFGLNGDVPVQEDYDGDGKFDIAVYRPSNGVWHRLNSSDGSYFSYQWGLAGDVPVPADYDGDLKINIAVWRPSNGYWYYVNPDLVSTNYYVLGASTDLPLPGKY